MTAYSQPTDKDPVVKIGFELNTEPQKFKTTFDPCNKIGELQVTRKICDCLVLGAAINVEP